MGLRLTGSGVAGIDAYDGETESVRAAEMPGGHRASLERDPCCTGSPALDSCGHRLQGGGALALPHHLAETIHHAYGRLCLRHVKPDELLLLHDRFRFPAAQRYRIKQAKRSRR